jgi:hypothetical protein
MKKSTVYQLAAIAVMESNSLTGQDKLEVLRVLFSDEDVSIFIEKQKAKEQENVHEGE